MQEQPVDPFGALSLCGEIAIAIIGFSGIVLVFGRSRADWDDFDRLRFRMLFTATLIPIGIIAFAFILDAGGVNRISIWRSCSSIHAFTALLTAFANVRAGARMETGRSDLQIPRFKTIWRGGAITLSIALVVIGIQILNAVSLHLFWPVLLAIWWGIALSLMSFVGLMRVLAK
jgi:hypothetical protein